ncbi:sensory neuron membrane protein 1-like, partial [Hyalella azteca]|uniref:Sensory neuron membrane protein 1-like n=1 Tax=Hyalella azteca TaxID=294128 RepID=A0A979FPY8_HYAAZ
MIPAGEGLADMIPELGVPISVRARMQLNMAVVPYKSLNFLGLGRIDILAKVKEVILPLIWFEVSAGLTEELAKDLKPVMFLLHTPTMTIIWSLLVV